MNVSVTLRLAHADGDREREQPSRRYSKAWKKVGKVPMSPSTISTVLMVVIVRSGGFACRQRAVRILPIGWKGHGRFSRRGVTRVQPVPSGGARALAAPRVWCPVLILFLFFGREALEDLEALFRVGALLFCASRNGSPGYRSEAGEKEELVVGECVAAAGLSFFRDAKYLAHIELHEGISREGRFGTLPGSRSAAVRSTLRLRSGVTPRARRLQLAPQLDRPGESSGDREPWACGTFDSPQAGPVPLKAGRRGVYPVPRKGLEGPAWGERAWEARRGGSPHQP